MYRCDTVNGMAANDGEMCHVDSLLALLLDQGHATKTIHVPRILGGDLLQVKEVYVVNDLQVSRKDVVQHARWPSFEGFRKHRVIRIGAGSSRDVPSLLPDRGQQTFVNIHRTP